MIPRLLNLVEYFWIYAHFFINTVIFKFRFIFATDERRIVSGKSLPYGVLWKPIDPCFFCCRGSWTLHTRINGLPQNALWEALPDTILSSSVAKMKRNLNITVFQEVDIDSNLLNQLSIFVLAHKVAYWKSTGTPGIDGVRTGPFSDWKRVLLPFECAWPSWSSSYIHDYLWKGTALLLSGGVILLCHLIKYIIEEIIMTAMMPVNTLPTLQINVRHYFAFSVFSCYFRFTREVKETRVPSNEAPLISALEKSCHEVKYFQLSTRLGFASGVEICKGHLMLRGNLITTCISLPQILPPSEILPAREHNEKKRKKDWSNHYELLFIILVLINGIVSVCTICSRSWKLCVTFCL